MNVKATVMPAEGAEGRRSRKCFGSGGVLVMSEALARILGKSRSLYLGVLRILLAAAKSNSRMKYCTVICATLIFSGSVSVTRAQIGHDLFQQALVKEKTEGNLDQAIKLYERIVSEFGNDRDLAAQALLQIGKSYENLGIRKASQAYERIIREFSDQAKVATEARVRLDAIQFAASEDSIENSDKQDSSIVLRRLFGGNQSFQEVSKDGRFLARTDSETGKLEILDSITGAREIIPNNDTDEHHWSYAGFPVFSPDGKQIAFLGMDANMKMENLNIANREDGKTKRLLDNSFPVDWSPDGRHLAVMHWKKEGDSMNMEVSLVSPSSGEVRSLVEPLGWSNMFRFSPDGRFLAYDYIVTRRNPDSSEINIIDLASGKQQVLVTHFSSHKLIGWAPHGASILFTSKVNGGEHLLQVKVNKSGALGIPEIIKSNIGDVHPIRVTRNGDLYFNNRIGRVSKYYQASIDPTAGKVIEPLEMSKVHGIGFPDKVRMSPDGQRLIVRSLTNQPHVKILDSETGEVVREFPDSKTWAPAIGWWWWKQDMTSVLVTLGRIGGWNPGCYLMDAETGELSPFFLNTPLNKPSNVTSEPTWKGSFLGDSVAYFRRHREEKQLFIVMRNLKTGNEKAHEIVDNAEDRSLGQWITAPFLNSDWKSVFFNRELPDKSGYVVVGQNLETGELKEFMHSKTRVQINGDWEGNRIAMRAEEPDGNHIYRLFSLEKFELRKITDLIIPKEFKHIWGIWDGPTLVLAKLINQEKKSYNEIWFVDVESGKYTKTDLLVPDDYRVKFSRDGTQILMRHDVESTSELWVMENFLPSTGKAPQ